MPETTLHPSAQRKTDAVVAQPVLTKYQALRQAGWLVGIDFVFMFLIGTVGVTLLFWRIFGDPTQWNVVMCLLVTGLLLQIWLVLLVLRCARFVLEVTAYVNTLPDDAARIVMSAYSGGFQKR